MDTNNNSIIISEKFKQQLITGILSVPIIYIPHYHYNYLDAALSEIFSSESGEYNEVVGLCDNTIYEWDVARGRIDFKTKNIIAPMSLDSILKMLLSRNDNVSINDNKVLDDCKVFLFKNIVGDVTGYSASSSSKLNEPSIQTLLQAYAEKYDRGECDNRTTIIIISPMPFSMLPACLKDYINLIEIPAPTVEEIYAEIAKTPVAKSVSRRWRDIPNGEKSFRDDLTNSLLGLQMYDVKQIVGTVMARQRVEQNFEENVFGRDAKKLALGEKQKIVKKSGIIEIIDTDVTLDDVGGLERLKDDIRKKSIIYRHINEVGKVMKKLPIPKGILIMGMPGCGKSMIAKAIASEFKVSLLRLDVNRLMGQYVGMSEENLRRALQTAETAHPCVLWIDEVEKAFAGAGAGGGANDGDMLVQRLMGQFLTWMQERKTAVYIVATANDVMRPEFMRKGRFDEVYFVDFPNLKERKAILKAKMRQYGFLSGNENYVYSFSEFESSGVENEKFNEIAKLMAVNSKAGTKYSTGFSGAEIESVVNQVMENVFVKYQKAIDDKQQLTGPIRVTMDDFIKIIEPMKKTIMANQVTSNKEKENNPYKKTNIERIRELQDTYKFTYASYEKSEN